MSQKTITPGSQVPTVVKFGDLVVGDYFVHSATVGDANTPAGTLSGFSKYECVWLKIDELNAVLLGTAGFLTFEGDEPVMEVDIFSPALRLCPILVWHPAEERSSQ